MKINEYVKDINIEQVGEIWLQHFSDLIAIKHKAHSEKCVLTHRFSKQAHPPT